MLAIPRLLTPALILFCLCATARAEVINVAPGPDNDAAPLYQAVINANSGDEIILAPGIYIFRASAFEDTMYGPLAFEGKQNITVKGDGKAYVFCTDPYGTPLDITNCSNITIQGVRMGHAPQRGFCAGGVVSISDSKNIVIEDCVLHGSGVFALNAFNTDGLVVERCAMVECTSEGIYAMGLRDAVFRDCLIVRNDSTYYRSQLFSFVECHMVLVTGSIIADNDTGFMLNQDSYGIDFRHNIFANNTFTMPSELPRTNTEVQDVVAKNYLQFSPNSTVGPSTMSAARAYEEFQHVYVNQAPRTE